MKNSSPWFTAAMVGTVSLLVLSGCKSYPEHTGDTVATPVANESEWTVVKNGITYNIAELIYPTGEKATSALQVRQASPAEMRVGQEYEYTIDVKNLTKSDLQNVEVHAEHFANLVYATSTPPFTRVGPDELVWRLGDLPASSTKQIVLKGKAAAIGAATSCLTVRYANTLCLSSNVVQPSLQLTKTATPELCGTCDAIRLTYEVKNAGTGVAEKTMITDTLPAGITTSDGKSTVEINAGDIGPGKSKPFTVMAKAAKAGTFASAASATAYPSLTAKSESPATVVKTPALAVTCEATGKVYVGRDITYKLTVKNSGDCAAANAVVTAPIPAGTSFVSADSGGRLDGNKVVWTMSSVAPGQSANVSMKVKPSGIGSVPISASAQAACVPAVSTNCSTEVSGIPAILLEVVDTSDPIEVGSTTTFVVTATNQGSAADTNVTVIGTLPAEMEFVSATGSSAVTANGQTVTMTGVPSLAPKAKAEWRIVVRAKGEGDVRSKWEMTSTQFKVSVTETESTTLYK